eukprot:529374_1
MYLYSLRNSCAPINVVVSDYLFTWDSKAKLCDIWLGSKCIIDCSPLGKSYAGVKSQVVCKYDEPASAFIWGSQLQSLYDSKLDIGMAKASSLEQLCKYIDVHISKISSSEFVCSWEKSGAERYSRTYHRRRRSYSL